MRRIIALVTVIAILSCISLPAFADYSSEDTCSFWEKWLADGAALNGISPSDWLLDTVSSHLSPNVCPSSPDGYHHSASGKDRIGRGGNFGHPAVISMSCDYCGENFDYDANCLQDDFNNFLSDNNLNNCFSVTPSGSLIYYLDDNSSFVSRVHSIVVSPYVLVSDSVLSNHVYYRVLQYKGDTPLSLGISNGSFQFSGSYPFSGVCRLCFSNTVNDGGGSFQSDFVTVMVDDTFNVSFSGHADFGTYVSSSPIQPDDLLYQSFGPLYLEYISVSGVSPSVPSIPSSINIDNNDYSVRDFNFSTRTFNVTNENGDDITITYGDNTYTVTNNTTNTTVNNYYYITNNNGGGDSGGGSSSSDTDYTNILTQIRDLCAQILERIGIGGGSSPSTIVPELTEEEDSNSFILTFLSKFGFINQIYHIVVQMAADVTNDSVSAQAVADGAIPIGALTSAHASTDASSGDSGDDSGGSGTRSRAAVVRSDSATAPEVLTRFGSNAEIGLDLSGYSAIDLSWYAPYKPTIDSILSGFMWLGYIWLLFKRLPDLIRGGAMAADKSDSIDWYMGWK